MNRLKVFPPKKKKDRSQVLTFPVRFRESVPGRSLTGHQQPTEQAKRAACHSSNGTPASNNLRPSLRFASLPFPRVPPIITGQQSENIALPPVPRY